MALSGSVDYSRTARQLITFALKKIRVIASDETPSAQDAVDGMETLNLILKDWQKYENLWRLTEGSITLVASTYSYTMSPVPHRVISARYRDANSRDIPMMLMSREDYFNLPDKSVDGVPTQYYVDYQRAATTFYVWPGKASVTTETIKHTYLKKFDDIDSLDNDIEVRQEHYNTLAYHLAAQLADEYGRSGPVIDRIIARSEVLLEQSLDEDREDEYRFIPDMEAFSGGGSRTPY